MTRKDRVHFWGNAAGVAACFYALAQPGPIQAKAVFFTSAADDCAYRALVRAATPFTNAKNRAHFFEGAPLTKIVTDCQESTGVGAKEFTLSRAAVVWFSQIPPGGRYPKVVRIAVPLPANSKP
jgi:hypothetical protein